MADDIVNQINHLPLSRLREYFGSNTIERQGKVYDLVLESAESVSEEIIAQMFDLFRRNMKEMYITSSFGWDEQDKMKEMREFPTRSLIVMAGLSVLGFLNYQITKENGMGVAYCYELQLEECIRGLGIGKELMLRMENIARKCGIYKAMLTVFINNPAINFYYRYTVDVVSPKIRVLRSGKRSLDYMILSKQIHAE